MRLEYDSHGFRPVRAGTRLAATEHRRHDVRTVQMAGEGSPTESELVAYLLAIDAAEGRNGR